MKVVMPERPDHDSGGRSTLTARLMALSPSPNDLVDAAFLTALVVAGLLGWWGTFDSPRYLLVGFVAVLIGGMAAHVITVLRWHWALTVPLAALLYFLLGGPIAVQADLVVGVLPSLVTFSDLAGLAVFGWKDLLTTLPPVDGAGPFVALPFLLALAAGVFGFSLARRSRRPVPGMLGGLLVLPVVGLLGTARTALPGWATGLAAAVIAFGWLSVRTQRYRRLGGVGTSPWSRRLSGAGLLAVAAVAGLLVTPLTPAADLPQRVVLRSYVRPPVDLSSYTSPLATFRTFSSERLKLYYDADLLKVSGLQAGSLLRFAALDDYADQTVWGASGGGDGRADSGFQRVGSRIPATAAGETTDVSIEVLDAYAGNRDLSAWVPGVGPATGIAFDGANARAHAADYRYNLSTGQVLLPGRLQAGDQVRETATPIRTATDQPLAPGSTPAIDEGHYGFLTEALKQWSASKGSAWEQLTDLAGSMRRGAYSDGTRPGEAIYPPGHGRGRLLSFLSDAQLVGSDEQYAATFALAANAYGFPARVVFGAVVPEGGIVRGRDVYAWVEVFTDAGDWVAIPPSMFIPDRNTVPEKKKNERFTDATAIVVPPPNPLRPPGSLDSLLDTDSRGEVDPAAPVPAWQRILAAILAWAGPPLLAIGVVVGLILLARGVRRWRRRSRGPATARIAGGWRDLVDTARDLGGRVDRSATRLEQARALGAPGLVELSRDTDQLVFGPGEPEVPVAAAFWTRIDKARSELRQGAPRLRRLRSVVSLRSFLPSGRHGAASVPVPVRPPSPGRAAVPEPPKG